MKFKQVRGVGKPGEWRRASEVMRVTDGNEQRFDVTHLLSPDDLVAIRSHYHQLVGGGRLNNASVIVSALSLAYGQRPDGFETPVDVYKRYIDARSFQADGVLQDVLIAFPEYRAGLQAVAQTFWQEYTQREPVSRPLKPRDFVLYKSLVPAEQTNLFFDPVTLETEEDQLLKDITDGSHLGVIASKLSDLLICDPDFRLRIRQVEDLQQRLREGFTQYRLKGSANDWYEATILLKALVFLSADHVEISNKGDYLIRLHKSHTSTQPSIPARDLV